MATISPESTLTDIGARPIPELDGVHEVCQYGTIRSDLS